MRGIVLLVLGVTLGVVGCQSYQPSDPVALREALSQAQQDTLESKAQLQVPDAVEQSLLPEPLALGIGPVRVDEKRFEVAANNVSAANFFGSLFSNTPYSFAIHPGVNGSISLDLKDVTLEETLRLLERLYGYQIERDGHLYNIYPAGLRTQTFSVNYLMMTRQSSSRTTVNMDTNGGGTNIGTGSSSTSSSQRSGGSTVIGTDIRTDSGSDFWAHLGTALSAIVGQDKGQSVVISPQTGLVTVRAFPEQLREVKQFLVATEQNLHRQVILEAKILEVTLRDGYQQGIDWGSLGSGKFGFDSAIRSTLPSGSLVTLASGVGGGGILSYGNSNFSTAISLLNSQGDVNVLSSPRITALNNQKAVIKVGSNEYFVTNISTQNSASTTENTTTIPSTSIELQPFFSGIALDVTPQIDSEGQVTLHIHPAVVNVTAQEKEVDLGSNGTGYGVSSDSNNSNRITMPTAKSEVRESDTVVRARSGSVIVIGGLMKTLQEQLHSQTPGVGDIPVVGELFKNKRRASLKTELVILLKPIVVGPNTWQQQLKLQADLLERWYPQPTGGTP